MVYLKGKKILLIMPYFHNYHELIADELEKAGANVWRLQDDFINDSVFYRFVWRKVDCLKNIYVNKKFTSHLSVIPNDLDYVFIIKGTALTEQVVQSIKDKSPSAIFINYQWDSIKNSPNALLIADKCKYNYTFDPEDAERLSWKYLPLFYYGENNEKTVKRYDFAYVATLYYKRAKILNLIREYCEKNNYSLYEYVYANKWTFFLRKYILRDKNYRNIQKSDVRFSTLKKDELSQIYKLSRILVDYKVETQKGLTMRTIESIGFRCKLITNSNFVKECDFYTPNNIFVYDVEKFDIPKSFVESDYEELSSIIMQEYSCENWVKHIFCME